MTPHITKQINGGYLERSGWKHINTNYYAKGIFHLWYFDKWTLEIAPKSASERAVVIMTGVETTKELRGLVRIAEKENCTHEKIYYCLVTGGGRCRKCKKLV